VLDRPTGEVRSILEEGKAAINDPNRLMAVLVSRPEETAIATSRYLWGSAQQVGLTVGGVLLTSDSPAAYEASFAPLPVYGLPLLSGAVPYPDWQPLMAALPDPLALAKTAPRPVTIDAAARTVSLFLPSFDKSQVKLIQSGPEVTIEAGDQRRNLLLPPTLAGRSVKGAKFQDQHLVLTFA
ncbi:MAG: ArsA family ATPase, partial [Cyanobacteria bacterium Co-bin13]|nr:ArsA family ATPase [Cyanobacteria bacterium Co-bin13]